MRFHKEEEKNLKRKLDQYTAITKVYSQNSIQFLKEIKRLSFILPKPGFTAKIRGERKICLPRTIKTNPIFSSSKNTQKERNIRFIWELPELPTPEKNFPFNFDHRVWL